MRTTACSHLQRKLHQYRAEEGGPEAAGRAFINAIGNYAFLLALLHVNQLYAIDRTRLSLRLVSPDVNALREYVKGEMVRGLLLPLGPEL